MKILQRYVFRELVLPFLVSLGVLNFIFMAGYLVKAAHFIIGRGVPISDTLYVLLLAIPEMTGYTVPTSILLAVLVVFGSLSQNNELRAMKASGIYLLQILFPAFLAGLILSIGMFIFTDQVTSNSTFELRRATKKMIIKYPKALIEPGRFVKLSDNIIFLAKKMEGDKLYDIVSYEVEESDKPVRTIIAEWGEVTGHPEMGGIQIKLYNGSISDTEDEAVNTIQFESYEFPSLGKEDIRNMKKKKRDLTLAEIILALAQNPTNKKDILELWTTFHERISFALGSFIFVLIGIPAAILVRRGEVVLSFAFAMAASSVYYVLFASAKTLSMQSVLPPFVALWVPNLLLLGIGIKLLRRAIIS